MFIVGAAASALMLTTGIALFVVVRKKQREARMLEVAPVPTLGAGGPGLALFARF
jgi:hypothetical protein